MDVPRTLDSLYEEYMQMEKTGVVREWHDTVWKVWQAEHGGKHPDAQFLEFVCSASVARNAILKYQKGMPPGSRTPEGTQLQDMAPCRPRQTLEFLYADLRMRSEQLFEEQHKAQIRDRVASVVSGNAIKYVTENDLKNQRYQLDFQVMHIRRVRARVTSDFFEKVVMSNDKLTSLPRPYDWDMLHSFYAASDIWVSTFNGLQSWDLM